MTPLRAGDPRRIGPFALDGRIGSGGMGTVYAGHGADGVGVAVKVVRDDLADDHAFRTRFQREIDAVRTVDGRFTARLVEADAQAEQPWMAVELVDGQSLQRTVEEHGPLDPPTVRALAVGLADALRAIHAVGLVHRDLKPSNVLLAVDGPRVVDFGIARAADATQLTLTGAVVGSPAFMSPEQARGETPGTEADIYALAATLVFAATGRPPHSGDSPHVLLYKVLHEEPDLEQLGALDDAVRRLITDALAPNASARPTAQQILGRLNGGGADHATIADAVIATWHLPAGSAPLTGVPTGPPKKRKRPFPIAVAALTVIAAAIAILYFGFRDPADKVNAAGAVPEVSPSTTSPREQSSIATAAPTTTTTAAPSVRDIDWANATYSSACFYSSPTEQPITLNNGEAVEGGSTAPDAQSLYLGDVLYGDFDGDGAEEAALMFSCFLGNGTLQSVEVHDIDRGRPERVADLDLSQGLHALGTRMIDGDLAVIMDYGECRACAEGYRTVVYEAGRQYQPSGPVLQTAWDPREDPTAVDRLARACLPFGRSNPSGAGMWTGSLQPDGAVLFTAPDYSRNTYPYRAVVGQLWQPDGSTVAAPIDVDYESYEAGAPSRFWSQMDAGVGFTMWNLTEAPYTLLCTEVATHSTYSQSVED